VPRIDEGLSPPAIPCGTERYGLAPVWAATLFRARHRAFLAAIAFKLSNLHES